MKFEAQLSAKKMLKDKLQKINFKKDKKKIDLSEHAKFMAWS